MSGQWQGDGRAGAASGLPFEFTVNLTVEFTHNSKGISETANQMVSLSNPGGPTSRTDKMSVRLESLSKWGGRQTWQQSSALTRADHDIIV